MGWFRI